MIWASSEGFKVDSITWQEGEGRKEGGGLRENESKPRKQNLIFILLFETGSLVKAGLELPL